MKFPHCQEIILHVCVCIFILHSIRCEFYTALSELSQLLVTEENILNSLDTYLEIEEKRLQKVKWKRELFGRIHEQAVASPEEFLSNPVNAFLLIKRLTTDWYETYNFVESPYSRDLFKKSVSEVMLYPEENDLIGAAEAILRLQETYSLDAADLAMGQIKGATLSNELAAGDCFILGLHSYHSKELKTSLHWFQEALKRMEKDERSTLFEKIEVYIHMANVYNSLQNFTGAAEVSENILKLDPNHMHAKENLKFYRTKEAELKVKGDSTTVIQEETEEDVTSYTRLCRGEKLKSKADVKPLYCYLTTNNNSYFLLQPIKTEILNLKPRVVMQHNVLNEGEAEMLMALAYPKLEQLTGPEDETDRPHPISKGAWLPDYGHSVIEAVSKRVKYLTGLNTELSESFQVVNYGIGGHYEPHVDYALEGEETEYSAILGNRMATWMLYLSDVEAGGSTVFTNIGVEVKPAKGSALFWYNLHRNGTGVEDTLHAACPVLVGSKWIANKWLHEYGNEFNRPCKPNQLR